MVGGLVLVAVVAAVVLLLMSRGQERPATVVEVVNWDTEVWVVNRDGSGLT